MKNRLYLSLMLTVLLGLIGWNVQAQLQKSGPARQAWEYKSWVFVVDARQNTFYEDGKPISGSATPVTRAPELGTQGWELVSVAATESPGTGTYIYWFKRPK